MISNGIATPTRLRGVYNRRTIEKYLQQETDKQNKQTRTKDKQNKQTEAQTLGQRALKRQSLLISQTEL